MWDRKTQETWASLKSTKVLRPHILRTTCQPQQAKAAPSELKGEGPREPEAMRSLSHQRPRAGPLKDRLYIDCNEEKYQMYNHQQSEASTWAQ